MKNFILIFLLTPSLLSAQIEPAFKKKLEQHGVFDSDSANECVEIMVKVGVVAHKIVVEINKETVDFNKVMKLLREAIEIYRTGRQPCSHTKGISELFYASLKFLWEHTNEEGQRCMNKIVNHGTSLLFVKYYIELHQYEVAWEVFVNMLGKLPKTVGICKKMKIIL